MREKDAKKRKGSFPANNPNVTLIFFAADFADDTDLNKSLFARE